MRLYLVQHGHACFIYDQNPLPGGQLRYGVSEDILPKAVLDAEISGIADLGVEFFLGRTLGEDLEWDKIKESIKFLCTKAFEARINFHIIQKEIETKKFLEKFT